MVIKENPNYWAKYTSAYVLNAPTLQVLTYWDVYKRVINNIYSMVLLIIQIITKE